MDRAALASLRRAPWIAMCTCCLAENYGTSTDGLSRATESKPKTARKCFDYTNTGCADEDVGCFQWCVCPSSPPGGN